MTKAFFFSLMLASGCITPVASQSQWSAREAARQMTPGWNLGNTLEAGGGTEQNYKNSGVGTETWWQQTKTTQEVIDYVKSKGFKSVRIPCAWVMGHISDPTTYQIDPSWMARVKEVVDYCIDAGLFVVLNDHWDGGWLENHIADTSPNTVAGNKAILKKIWTQIAEVFRDYDEHLIFAGLNEPGADNQSATNNLMDYHQVFVDAVRATGGNNAERVLIVQGPSTNIEHTTNFMDHLPADQNDDRLMVEVHFYTPWNFWGMEKG